MATLLSTQVTTTSRHHISTELAQKSCCYIKRSCLSKSDISLIASIQSQVQSSGYHDNPQNESHHHANGKHCTFLSRPAGPSLPENPLRSLAPSVLGKLLRFVQGSWASSDWSSENGPLSSIPGPETTSGGVGNLSLRIAEHWHYDIGGHLDNDLHFDQGSVITIVTGEEVTERSENA